MNKLLIYAWICVFISIYLFWSAFPTLEATSWGYSSSEWEWALQFTHLSLTGYLLFDNFKINRKLNEADKK